MECFQISDFIDGLCFSNKKTNEYLFLEYIHDNNYWDFMLNNCEFNSVVQTFKDEFHQFWIERGEFIRQAINNDKSLASLLWKLLTSYQGEEKILYRGENIERYKANRLGFCWTDDINVARRFSTRNACDNGGIILSGTFDKNTIIAGIHSHSNYLREFEYTLDSFMIKNIEIIL